MQNGRTDNMVTGVLPTYVGPDELRYTHNKALIFPAGNEYRRFETVSTRYANIGVESLQSMILIIMRRCFQAIPVPEIIVMTKTRTDVI